MNKIHICITYLYICKYGPDKDVEDSCTVQLREIQVDLLLCARRRDFMRFLQGDFYYFKNSILPTYRIIEDRKASNVEQIF